MTTFRCVLVRSSWCAGAMSNSRTATILLTHDLEARSKGSPGRRLLGVLDDCELDLLGTSSALEFAKRLRDDEASARGALEELLEWVVREDDLVLVALVALAPRLDRVAARLSRGQSGEDAVAEVLAQATRALSWAHEQAPGERVAFVLAEAHSKSRSERRKMSRHNVPAGPLPDHVDLAAPDEPAAEALETQLERAIERGVITPHEYELIVSTRRDRRRLSRLGGEATGSYDALRMRRARAETRLRHFLAMEARS